MQPYELNERMAARGRARQPCHLPCHQKSAALQAAARTTRIDPLLIYNHHITLQRHAPIGLPALPYIDRHRAQLLALGRWIVTQVKTHTAQRNRQRATQPLDQPSTCQLPRTSWTSSSASSPSALDNPSASSETSHPVDARSPSAPSASSAPRSLRLFQLKLLSLTEGSAQLQSRARLYATASVVSVYSPGKHRRQNRPPSRITVSSFKVHRHIGVSSEYREARALAPSLVGLQFAACTIVELNG